MYLKTRQLNSDLVKTINNACIVGTRHYRAVHIVYLL